MRRAVKAVLFRTTYTSFEWQPGADYYGLRSQRCAAEHRRRRQRHVLLPRRPGQSESRPQQQLVETAYATYDSLENDSGNQSDPRGANGEAGGARQYTSETAQATIQIIPVEVQPKTILQLSNTPSICARDAAAGIDRRGNRVRAAHADSRCTTTQLPGLSTICRRACAAPMRQSLILMRRLMMPRVSCRAAYLHRPVTWQRRGLEFWQPATYDVGSR